MIVLMRLLLSFFEGKDKKRRKKLLKLQFFKYKIAACSKKCYICAQKYEKYVSPYGQL